jgi:hypothetical protein
VNIGGSKTFATYGLPCWEGLSPAQQRTLIERGVLDVGWRPDGSCDQPPRCEVITADDEAPGPRFYCYDHAIAHLQGKLDRLERR